MLRYSILLGLMLLIVACDRGGNTLSLDLGYGEPSQFWELGLGIVPEEWEGSEDSIEAWTHRYEGWVSYREQVVNQQIILELRIPPTQADSLITRLKTQERPPERAPRRGEISIRDIL